MSFFQDLERRTAGERAALYRTPQIVDALAGRIQRTAYIAYLTEAYHHVSHTVPLLRSTRDHLSPAQRRYAPALDDYIAEETGHELWILQDIIQAGGDGEAVRNGRPDAATSRMVDYAYDQIRNHNPLGFFGMVYVLESTSIALATQGAEAVARSLGLGPECFSYLSSHGALDQAHMAGFAALMDTIDAEADRTAIVTVASAVFGLFADIFRNLPEFSDAV